MDHPSFCPCESFRQPVRPLVRQPVRPTARPGAAGGPPVNRPSGPRPRLRRRPLVVALLLACAAPSPGIALAAWGPNLEVIARAGDRRVGGGFELLAPLWQNARMLTFAEVKAGLDDQGTHAVNLAHVKHDPIDYRASLRRNGLIIMYTVVGFRKVVP